MTQASCTICHGTQLGPYPGKDGYTFIKCADCGYVVADPLPSAAELAALYDSAHFNSSYNPDNAESSEKFQQRKVQYEQDRDLFLEFLDGQRILDYGCGNGLFLGTFPDTLDKHGYELNPVTQGYLREQGAITVVPGDEQLAEYPDGHFDGVMMRGVIEHLIDPEATLALLASKLRVGGHFYLCATPNIDSPCALVYGTTWSQFTPPYHLHFFSPRTLAVLGARHGLALIESREPYLGTPYENATEDGTRFIRDAQARGAGRDVGDSVPFPGTMMSLVLRRMS